MNGHKHMSASRELRGATDSALFASMARGELGALGELFDRYHASVRALAERALADPSDADDLVQETFLTASRAAASFIEGSEAKPFLLGVTAQLVRRKRRSFVRLRGLLAAFQHTPRNADATPEDLVHAHQQRDQLDAALAKLSHAHREVLVMVDLGGLSGVDAAKALGIPAGTVWRRLHEARAALRTAIERRTR